MKPRFETAFVDSLYGAGRARRKLVRRLARDPRGVRIPATPLPPPIRIESLEDPESLRNRALELRGPIRRFADPNQLAAQEGR
jgi:hypothetical protein